MGEVSRAEEQPPAKKQRTVGTTEPEAAALGALEKLLQDPNQFLPLCRDLSDCQSATQPGKLSGDLGWLGRGQQEQSFEDAAFGLGVSAIGDLVTTSRGVH